MTTTRPDATQAYDAWLNRSPGRRTLHRDYGGPAIRVSRYDGTLIARDTCLRCGARYAEIWSVDSGRCRACKEPAWVR